MCFEKVIAAECFSDNENESDNGIGENETDEVPSKSKKTEKNPKYLSSKAKSKLKKRSTVPSSIYQK